MRLGDQPSQKFGRRTRSTSTCEQGNMRTNTEMEFCWTRNVEKKKIIDIEYINERAINDHGQPPSHQADERVLSPLGVCRPSQRKIYRTIEKHTNSSLKSIQIVEGDFQRRTGPRRRSVTCQCWPGNKRGDWLKQWLMIQNFIALNTMYRRTHGKQTTYRSPKGNEKQIHYILIKRRHLKHSKDGC